MIVYKLNYFWVTFNTINIFPLAVACWTGLTNPPKRDHLKGGWQETYTKLVLSVTLIYYVLDIVLKYVQNLYRDVCDTALLIHHIGALFIIMPLMLYRRVHWSTIAIAFEHSLLMTFPQVFLLNVPYVITVLIFHYNLYTELWKGVRYIIWTQLFINSMYVAYAIMGLCGCTNQLVIPA